MNISSLYCVDHYLTNDCNHHEIQKVSFISLIGFFSPNVLFQVCLMLTLILCISSWSLLWELLILDLMLSLCMSTTVNSVATPGNKLIRI